MKGCNVFQLLPIRTAYLWLGITASGASPRINVHCGNLYYYYWADSDY